MYSRAGCAQLKIYAGPGGLIAIAVRMVCRSLRTGRDGKGHGPRSPKAKWFFQTSIETVSLLHPFLSPSLALSAFTRNRIDCYSVGWQYQKRRRSYCAPSLEASLLLELGANNGHGPWEVSLPKWTARLATAAFRHRVSFNSLSANDYLYKVPVRHSRCSDRVKNSNYTPGAVLIARFLID